MAAPAKARVGSRVEVIAFNDPYTALPPGTRGTVTRIDDAGTLHTNFGLVPRSHVTPTCSTGVGPPLTSWEGQRALGRLEGA